MAYTLFTTEKLFTDESINILLNRIFTALEDKFTAASVSTDLGISGSVAKIIQGDLSAFPIELMPFVTSNKEVLIFLNNELSEKLKFDEFIAFSDHVKIKKDRVNIEFWLLTTPLNLITSQNFIVQATASIPNYIL